nr:hypothetical protein Q903MT_gene6152 [Picea sitchensis]
MARMGLKKRPYAHGTESERRLMFTVPLDNRTFRNRTALDRSSKLTIFYWEIHRYTEDLKQPSITRSCNC